MKVTIDGITYEGTPSEIRDIVENPPEFNDGHQNQHIDCPDNDNWNYPRRSPNLPGFEEPGVTWWDFGLPSIHRNWDGTPKVTCCARLMH